MHSTCFNARACRTSCIFSPDATTFFLLAKIPAVFLRLFFLPPCPPQLYAHEQTEAMLKYAGWTAEQPPAFGKFPAWVALPTGGPLAAPTDANMETYAEARYQEASLVGENRAERGSITRST